MRLLILNDDVNEVIQKVKDYAETHIFEMDDLLDMYNKQKPPAGDVPEHVCHIPDGFRIVYSMERQVVGLIRHISISVDAPCKVPHMLAVQEIIKQFGYTTDLFDCLIDIEDCGNNRTAINVIEKV